MMIQHVNRHVQELETTMAAGVTRRDLMNGVAIGAGGSHPDSFEVARDLV
jgi:hypothetical protein